MTAAAGASYAEPGGRPFAILAGLEDCVTEAFKAACRAVAVRTDFKGHPYFIWMRRASKEPFALSQIPFVYAVEEFPCALGACFSKLGRVDIRAGLAGNIAEEHGHGNPYETHKQTFLTYLSALGVPPRLLSPIEYPIGIRAFNENIRNYCLVHSAEEGAAMLGMIESLYSGISAQIAAHIQEQRWVEPGSQKHYAVHAALDVAHADELFRIAAPAWESPASRTRIETAMEMGAYFLSQVFLSMLPAYALTQDDDQAEPRVIPLRSGT